MSNEKRDSNDVRFAGLTRFAVALCLAAGIVFVLVRLGLWRGVMNLN
jgi:hypothetical protein